MYRCSRSVAQCATDLEHLYMIYSNPTHDRHQWLLLQFIVLLMMDAEGARNMQSIPAVVNKHNTARVASCWFIIYYKFSTVYWLCVCVKTVLSVWDATSFRLVVNQLFVVVCRKCRQLLYLDSTLPKINYHNVRQILILVVYKPTSCTRFDFQ